MYPSAQRVVLSGTLDKLPTIFRVRKVTGIVTENVAFLINLDYVAIVVTEQTSDRGIVLHLAYVTFTKNVILLVKTHRRTHCRQRNGDLDW